MEYDPEKIIKQFSHIKSLRQEERHLRDNCKIYESRLARHSDALPICERLYRLGIGLGELLAFHTAVSERAETNGLPIGEAAYGVIKDIRDYNNLGGMKKQLSDKASQIFTLNQISARQNRAITSLLKLQTYGITDEEIVNIYEMLNNTRIGK